MSTVASVYLFKEVLLSFTETSLAKMEAILQHTTYRNYVRDLRIIPNGYPEPFMDRTKFDEWLEACQEKGCRPYSPGTYGRRVLESPEDIESLDIDADDCHSKYKRVYRVPVALEKAGALLQNSIVRFARLKRLLSGAQWRLSRHSGRYKDCCSPQGTFFPHVWNCCDTIQTSSIRTKQKQY